MSAGLKAQKQIELTHLTEMAIGIAKEEHAAAQKGTISDEEARKRAAARITALRYDKNNYFWITDMHPRLVAHPLRPETDRQRHVGLQGRQRQAALYRVSSRP